MCIHGYIATIIDKHAKKVKQFIKAQKMCFWSLFVPDFGKTGT